MSSKYSSGKNAISECDRCGFRYKLKELKRLIIKTKNVNILVCKSCWEPDQPQLSLGLYPVDDPQAVRNPRPDTSYNVSGENALGNPSGGSRITQWGWNAVGLNNSLELIDINNELLATGEIGTVTVTTT